MIGKLTAALAAAGVMAGGAAWADTATDTLAVSATVAETCNIAVTGPLAFGTLALSKTGTTVQADEDDAGSVAVICTDAVDFGVTAAGANDDGNEHRMKNGSAYLQYDLYAGASVAAGTKKAPAAAWRGAGSAVASWSSDISGRLVGDQGVTAGNYTDTVTFTVTYDYSGG